jgi:hypothetical protein
MRTAPNIAQREILGLPGQPVALLADHLPARIADVNFSLVQRMLFGDLTRYGIPRARDGAYTNFYRRLRNPAIDDGFIAALKQGRTQVVAQVERLDGTEVVLAGGTRLRPDAVICATGYRRGLESLVGHLGVLRPNGVPFAYRGPPSIPPHRSCISPACGASSAARSAWARSTPGGSHEPLPATAYAWTRGNSAQQEQQEADRPRRSHDTAA